jgi:hypothetical protein
MSESMAYRAICPVCGGSILLVVDEPIVMKSCAKDIARAMREGYAVERVTVEACRALPLCGDDCSRRKAAKGKAKAKGKRVLRAGWWPD